MTLRAKNVTRDRELMTQGRCADRPWSRLRGLMGIKSLEEGQGLWIVPCNGIHSFGMRFPFDAVFLSRDLEVVALIEEMPPWRLGRIYRGAHSVIELPAGTIRATGTELGDRITLERRLDDTR